MAPLPALALVAIRPMLSPRPSEVAPGGRAFLTGVNDEVVLDRSMPLLRDVLSGDVGSTCVGAVGGMLCALYDGERVCLGDSDRTTSKGGEDDFLRVVLSVGDDLCDGSLFSISSRTSSSVCLDRDRFENALAKEADVGEDAAEIDDKLGLANDARGLRTGCAEDEMSSDLRDELFRDSAGEVARGCSEARGLRGEGIRGRSREDMPGGLRGNTCAPDGAADDVDGCVAMSSERKDAIDWRCCSVRLALCKVEELEGAASALLVCVKSMRGSGGAGSREDAVALLRSSTVDALCRRRLGDG